MEEEVFPSNFESFSMHDTSCKTEKSGVETVFIDVESDFFKSEPCENDPLEISGQEPEEYDQDVNSCFARDSATPGTVDVDSRGHLGVQTDDKPFKCKLCPRSYAQNIQLYKHQRVHTGGKPFKCEVCSKQFRINSHLKTHERVHTGEKPFKCKFCAKSFLVNCNLIRHQMIHTGKTPFKCKICSTLLSDLSSLKRHEKVHTGEKPFKCSFCSKTFAQRSTLLTHVRVHTGEKPYVCKVCSKPFTARSNYIIHEKIHLNKPFRCRCCGKSFANNSDLENHEKTHRRKSNEAESNQVLQPSKRFLRSDVIKKLLLFDHSKTLQTDQDTNKLEMSIIKKEFPGNEDTKEFGWCNGNNVFIMGDGSKEYARKGFIMSNDSEGFPPSEDTKQFIVQDPPLQEFKEEFTKRDSS